MASTSDDIPIKETVFVIVIVLMLVAVIVVCVAAIGSRPPKYKCDGTTAIYYNRRGIESVENSVHCREVGE